MADSPGAARTADVLGRLRTLADPARLEGMARHGVGGAHTLGVTVAERADDDRPVVRRGASWALRQMGKRSPGLHARAVETAQGLRAGAGAPAGSARTSCGSRSGALPGRG